MRSIGRLACFISTILVASVVGLKSASAQEFLYTCPFEIPEPSGSEFRLWSQALLSTDNSILFENSRQPANGFSAHSLEFEKSLTPQTSLAGYLNFLAVSGEPPRFSGVNIEGRYRFGNRGDHFFDTALYFEYALPREGYGNESERLEMRVILEKIVGDFDYRLNPIFTKPMAGEKAAGLKFSSALSASWIRYALFQPGIELYSEYGRMSAPDSFETSEQTLAVSLTSYLNEAWSLQATYGAGLTNSANRSTAQLILTYEPPPSFPLLN